MYPLGCHTQPDSLTGAILAIEGIRDAAVLLNGPTGCKFYHGAVAEGQLPRESAYDPLRFLDEFHFGQPRIPATYLDGDDYVFGASEKLERILPIVAAKEHALIAVINSPGAALIGDDLERLVRQAGLHVPCVTIESTAYSGTFDDGFGHATIAALEALAPSPAKIEPRTVVLSGISIAHRFWEGDAAELRRLLHLCGIEVAAVLSAGATTEELREIRRAALNVVVHGEPAAKPAAWLKDRFGIDSIAPVPGAPLGFDQTDAWIRGVCQRVGVAADPAVAAIDAARARAVMHIKRLNSLTGLPKGATFAIDAPCSVAWPLLLWLREYLGMAPVAVRVSDPVSPLAHKIEDYLIANACESAYGREAPVGETDILFADGPTLARLALSHDAPAGVEIALPSRGHVDVVPKCMLGAQGALHILESILNELNRR
jgi:nitrogenase molybdenum-iron protein alpha/beta subunit